jgi:hypothetical protein
MSMTLLKATGTALATVSKDHSQCAINAFSSIDLLDLSLDHFSSIEQYTPAGVQDPVTIVDHSAPLGALGSAMHATKGEPAKPALHTPVQLPPAAVAAQVLGNKPSAMDAGGVPMQAGEPAAQHVRAQAQTVCSALLPPCDTVQCHSMPVTPRALYNSTPLPLKHPSLPPQFHVEKQVLVGCTGCIHPCEPIFTHLSNSFQQLLQPKTRQ